MSAWLHRPDPQPAPRHRLFCLPFAGGGIGIYRTWPGAAPEGLEVVMVQLPGRERRIREEAYRNMDALVSDLWPAVEPLTDVPFSIFGHSMGAAIAHELARKAAAASASPELLFLSSRRAPSVPPPHPPMYMLPDAVFTERLQELYGPFPDALKRHPGLLKTFLPTMKADLELLDTFEPSNARDLDCSLVTIAAQADHAVLPETVLPWSQVTMADTEHIVVPGGHFHVRDHHTARDKVMDILTEVI